MPPLRILHLPNVVGGHPVALANAETQLGATSHSLSMTNSPYGYQPDIQLNIEQIGRMRGWSRRIFQFLKLRNKYDVFYFNAGSSLLNTKRAGFDLVDLKYYPRNSIKIMTFQGSDARMEYSDTLENSLRIETEKPYKQDAKRTILGIERASNYRLNAIESTNRHCDHIFILNPDLICGLRKAEVSFLPYAIAHPLLGTNYTKTRLINNEPKRKPLRVVHLSTNRVLKGTGLIEDSLAEAAKQVPIDYEIIYKQPRKIALAKLANADIVIDQMVLGWYGAAAVEAMYLGKPVIGYIDNKYVTCVPEGLIHDLPIFRANSDTLAQKIVDLANDEPLQLELANRGIVFAEKWHSPISVAQSTLELYNRLRG